MIKGIDMGMPTIIMRRNLIISITRLGFLSERPIKDLGSKDRDSRLE